MDYIFSPSIAFVWHRSVFSLLLGASGVAAHSRLVNIVVDGVLYDGYDPKVPNNPDVLAAWGTTVTDDGWVNHEDYRGPNIVCHRDAVNAQGYAPVQAGSTVDVQWQGYPESHKGPVLTYLARCGDGPGACATANKTELEFFLVDSEGLIDPDVDSDEHASAPGYWASDLFRENNSSRVVQIPEDLAAGHYVLRQELIALHYALLPTMGGPQHYPQCVNIEVVGGGDARPAGVRATELYNWDQGVAEGEVVEADPGLEYDISSSPLAEYTVPGPTLYSGAATGVEQTLSTVTSSASAVPEDGAVRTSVVTLRTEPEAVSGSPPVPALVTGSHCAKP
ncbi:glycoside hydrolase family 61 protein [Sodiomyces alcalophilus JCM 7366]|uniref:glycoside hydrolase family 61 protein n=1 Tax=Sodiomyces alcalophilus JCM 7366 TaxID=591952 RepID=UPI0039B57999